MMLAGQLAGGGTILQYDLASLQDLEFGLRLQGSVNVLGVLGMRLAGQFAGVGAALQYVLALSQETGFRLGGLQGSVNALGGLPNFTEG